MSRRVIVAVAGLCCVIATVLTGCGTDGTTLRAPKPGASADSSSTTASGDPEEVVSLMALVSPSFVQRGAIPAEYSCQGANVSPPLQWANVPPDAQELAITVTDSDATDFVHWVVAGLPPTLSALGRGAVPEGSVQTKNDAGTVGWTGPCPPPGGPHHYTFTLFALGRASGVTDATPPHEAIDMIGQIPGQAATLIGTYQRS